MLLINHGLFTFGESAKSSYERMIKIVQEADNFLKRKIHLEFKNENIGLNRSLRILPFLRGLLGRISKNTLLMINGFLKYETIKVLKNYF